MFRLAFLVAVVFALLGGRHGDCAAIVTTESDSDRSQAPGPAVPAVAEPELDSDDDVAMQKEDRTECSVTAVIAAPAIEMGLGPSQSHSRRMDRPPRV